MTDDELRVEVRDLKERVQDLEDETDALARIPETVAELTGVVKILKELVLKVGNGAERIERASSLRTVVQYTAIVIVPILVALLGGYFLIKAGPSATGK